MTHSSIRGGYFASRQISLQGTDFRRRIIVTEQAVCQTGASKRDSIKSKLCETLATFRRTPQGTDDPLKCGKFPANSPEILINPGTDSQEAPSTMEHSLNPPQVSEPARCCFDDFSRTPMAVPHLF
jgi:hypothetical protein